MPDPLLANRIFDGQRLRCTVFGTGQGLFSADDNFSFGKTTFSQSKPSQRVLDAGFRHAVIQTSANDWYLYDELDDLVDLLRQHIAPHARNTALGLSMGAFAALLFSQALKTADLSLFRRAFPGR